MTGQTQSKGGLEGFMGSDLLGKMTELFSQADPRLDHIKKSVLRDIENLKKNPNLSSLAVNIWKSAETGLKKDLDELDVPDDKRKQILTEAKNKWDVAIQPAQMKEILESPEKIALDAYVADLENLPVLGEIINSSKPKEKWEIWLAETAKKIPFLGTIVDPILSFLGFKKETANRIAAAISEKSKGQKPAPAPTPAPTITPVAPEGQEAAINLTDEQKAAIKPLEDAGLKIETAKVQEDVDWLKTKGFDQTKIVELATNSAKNESNLRKKINQAIIERIGTGKISFRLKDIWLFDGSQLAENQIGFISEKIKEAKNDPVTVRKLLDNALNINKGDADERMLTVLEFEKLKANA
jgi:hypothetical protein